MEGKKLTPKQQDAEEIKLAKLELKTLLAEQSKIGRTVKKKHLLEIAAELDKVYLEIESNGGEINNELEELLQINEDEFNDKIDGYGYYLRRLKHDIEGIKIEIDRLAAKEVTLLNRINFLKEEVIAPALIKVYGEVKVKTAMTSIYTSNRQKIEVADIDVLDKRFVKDVISFNIAATDERNELIKSNLKSYLPKVVPQADKTKIKDYLLEDSTRTVTGAELIDTQSIIIR